MNISVVIALDSWHGRLAIPHPPQLDTRMPSLFRAARCPCWIPALLLSEGVSSLKAQSINPDSSPNVGRRSGFELPGGSGPVCLISSAARSI